MGGSITPVLVTDGEEGIRNPLDALLSRKGYDVVFAENGQRGLELFRHPRANVPVLDLNMSQMNGLTVLP